MIHARLRRLVALPMLAAASLLLTGCLLSPGKFTSELVLSDSGEFAFSYDGEIVFLGMSQLARMMADRDSDVFTPNCFDEDTYEDRECTEEETEDQREEWESGQEARAEKRDRDAEQMATIMGGIDPTDPDAADELVKLLQRQRGWDRVVHKGDGVFDISYRAQGTLSHDLVFPVIEKFVIPTPFVQVVLRKDGRVRVDAPSFAAQDSSNPMGGMMGGMTSLAALSALADDSGEAAPAVPELDGTFTIVTDGAILANNTDEGPEETAEGMQRLSWTITPRSTAAPTALLRLTQ